MIIPKQLIGLLNSGRCIAIIGSGPSCEMGFPAWGQLADKCLEQARLDKLPIDEILFARLMGKRDYLNVFKYLEVSFTRPKLVAAIQSHLVANKPEGKAYKLLTEWPFRLYMTTNWDSAIHDHLSRLGLHFTPVSNTQSEITQITDETSKQIVMLHGVLSDPDSLVITEDDYQQFKTGLHRQYFRETLKSLLRTLPSVVIGHSMTDPDLQTILEAAKTIAPSHRPIYMIVGDPHREDIDTYLSRYNIHLIAYKKDPEYTSFFKLLNQIGKFVVPRTGGVVRPIDPPQQQEIEVATSLLVFNSLSKSFDSPHLIDRLVYPQILQQLKRGSETIRTADFIPLLIPETLRTLPSIVERVSVAVDRLNSEKLICGSESDGWCLTETGDEKVLKATTTQRFEDDQVYGSLTGCLKNVGVTPEDCEKAAQSLNAAILCVFRKRGIAAASLVFRGQKFEPIDMAELFEAITVSVGWAQSFILRETYIDFAVRLFSSPTPEERRYLARVSQGLFAVHLFGMDPVAVDARTDVFRSASWFLDSNVLIHLLASGSTQHEMACSICDKCKRLGIRLFASDGVVQESLNSLEWASRSCDKLTAHEEMEFIFKVFSEDEYRRNPYIYGFVRSQQKHGHRRFADYRQHLGIDGVDTAEAKLNAYGISVVGLKALPRDDARRSEFSEYKNNILVERERRRTSRGGEFQASVEAEVMCLLLAARDKAALSDSQSEKCLEAAYFISTSRLLDHLFGSRFGTMTWFPDVFFKHLSFISPAIGDTEALIESLSSELAELGVTLVDQDAFRQYFDPLISSSRMSFAEERTKYVEALQDECGATAEDLQREFDATDDLSKPLFVSQMRWHIGAKGIASLEHELAEANRRQEQLSEKLKVSESKWQERQKTTIQHYENRIRNLSDPARREKIKRKARNKNKKNKRRRGK